MPKGVVLYCRPRPLQTLFDLQLNSVKQMSTVPPDSSPRLQPLTGGHGRPLLLLSHCPAAAAERHLVPAEQQPAAAAGSAAVQASHHSTAAGRSTHVIPTMCVPCVLPLPCGTQSGTPTSPLPSCCCTPTLWTAPWSPTSSGCATLVGLAFIYGSMGAHYSRKPTPITRRETLALWQAEP